MILIISMETLNNNMRRKRDTHTHRKKPKPNQTIRNKRNYNHRTETMYLIAKIEREKKGRKKI